MENLKIKLSTESENKEAQELFFELGFSWNGLFEVSHLDLFSRGEYKYLFAGFNKYAEKPLVQIANGNEVAKEITLPELRDMVVLKRNDVSDATHSVDGENGSAVMLNGVWYGYNFRDDKWELWNDDEEYKLKDLKPIEKKEMKEYLRKNSNGEYILEVVDEREAIEPHAKDWIELPEGAEAAVLGNKGNIYFWNGFSFIGGSHKTWVKMDFDHDFNWYLESSSGSKLIWQRERKETIESAVKDVVNSPDHYASGKFECIDAIESSMSKEAFLGYLKGNVQKYMWRYQKKGGVESLKKAEWHLKRMIDTLGD